MPFDPRQKPQESPGDRHEKPHDFLDKGKASIRGLLATPAPPMPFLVEKHILQVPSGLLSGFGSVGKSMYALQLALALASKQPFLSNPEFTIPKNGRTIFLSLEDDRAVFHSRIIACHAEMTRGMDPDQRMEVQKAVEKRVIIPPSGGKFFPLLPDGTKNVKALIDFANSYEHVRLILIDPLNLLCQADFTQNLLASQFAGVVREIHHETKATVITLSHTTKAGMARDGDGESSGDSVGVLGAVSLVNASRLVMTMRFPGAKFLNALELKGNPEDYVLVRNVKCNYLPRRDSTVLLQRVEGGALRYVPMEPPDPMAHPNGIADVVRQNPGIGKMDALQKYMSKAGVSRATAEGALDEGIRAGLISARKEGKNNKTVLEAAERCPTERDSSQDSENGPSEETDDVPF